MRLVDADAIIYVLDKRKNNIANTYGENDEYVKCISEVIQIIELQTEIKRE